MPVGKPRSGGDGSPASSARGHRARPARRRHPRACRSRPWPCRQARHRRSRSAGPNRRPNRRCNPPAAVHWNSRSATRKRAPNGVSWRSAMHVECPRKSVVRGMNVTQKRKSAASTAGRHVLSYGCRVTPAVQSALYRRGCRCRTPGPSALFARQQAEARSSSCCGHRCFFPAVHASSRALWKRGFSRRN